MKKLLLFFSIILYCASLAQDSAGVVLESQFETELHPQIQKEDLDSKYQELVSELRQDREYGYMRNLDSLLRSRNNVNQVNVSPFGRNIFDSPWFFYPAVAIVGIFVIYILFRIFGSSGFIFRRNKQKIIATEINDETESVDHGDLQSAIQSGNYRMATRILFLQTLDALHDAERIERFPGKSNREYIAGMQMPMKAEFKFLVIKYEYIWYGNHQPSKEQFDSIERDFAGFLNRYAVK